MDIYCKCGEPWDVDCLHELVSDKYPREKFLTNGNWDQAKYEPIFRRTKQDFRAKGCELFGTRHSNTNPAAGDTFAAIDDIMGDDLDGAVSMMEDAEGMGLF